MLTDPQIITIDSTQHSCAKISIGQESALYRNGDTTVSLRTSHQHNKGRTRSMIRVDQSKIAADPITEANVRLAAGVYLVIDKPDVGFSEAEIVNIFAGLNTLLTASTNAILKKLIAGES